MGKPSIRSVVICLVLLFCLSTVYSTLYADDADVLPKGVFQLGAESKFYFNTNERYNPDGELEDVAIDYNTSLNSKIFPDLGLFELPPPYGFGMPPGSASLGDSVVSFDYKFADYIFTAMYGITDRLTVGVIIPYYWQKNNVGAELDTSTATVGRNPLYGTPADPFGVPFIPISVSESLGYSRSDVVLTTEDILNLLTQEFGYERFETWSGTGIGDIEAGFRYQYLKTDKWRLAFTGGVRFPTGEVDDPDNLTDFEFGTGAYALLFRSNNDYTGIKNLLLNATFRYDLVLPDSEVKRIPLAVDRPVTPNKEDVDRNLGDRFEFEISGKYTLSKGLTISLLYSYWSKLKDRISGNKGYAYESLEDETDATSHVYIVGLCYSTVPLFMEKKFPVPLNAYIAYRDRFAGSNNALDTSYITLGLQVYF